LVTNVGNILDAAQRVRLLAIQKTARQLDVASARLASGLKVNSAIDSPSRFFLARALTNRAGDLEKLLDGIGQNIRAVQVADNGIKASLKILDLAESYLLDVEKKYLAGEVGIGNGPAPNETPVTFASNADLIPYDAGQDAPASGTITVTGTNEVEFSGNYWRRKAFNYNVTANTVLVFEFRSTTQPEIAAIGFDNDTNFGNDDDRFYLYGTQTTGITYSAPTPTFAYSGSGGWEQIEIPVGQYFTGNYSHMTFIHDDDAAPFGNAAYRNIILREGPSQVANDGAAFEAGYAKIVNQLDDLVQDAHYRGINLLKGDDMTTYFNPARTSKLVTEGIDATFAGLGLDVNDFDSIGAVRAKLAQVRAARNTLRQFGSTLATDLNVIKIRENFTRAQINTSRAGVGDLTLADPNEEGANLLALQTRQQIQTSILALRPPNILSILS
jgi:flagellin